MTNYEPMFRLYRRMGVQWRIEAGKIRCDHAVLDAWFQRHGTPAHLEALEVVLAEPAPVRTEAALVPTVADRGITMWHKGVKNAKANEAKEQKRKGRYATRA